MTQGARGACEVGRAGPWLAVALASLIGLYVVLFVAGMFARTSTDQAIGDPWLFGMELCILFLMPVLYLFVIFLTATAPPGGKTWGEAARGFMLATTILTMSVHFVLLTLGRDRAVADAAWWDAVFAFRWPSLVYALDILAWDVFFPMSMASAAITLRGDRTAVSLRFALWASGATSLAGLIGVVMADMSIRNIGIVGYTVLLIPVALLARRRFDTFRPARP